MPIAVGALETKGFPGILAAADAMVKIRGDVSEVKTSMAAGVEAATSCYGGTLESWVIIPRPHENVEAVLPIAFTEAVMRFHDSVETPLMPGRQA